jgi:hypothetical protein
MTPTDQNMDQEPTMPSLRQRVKNLSESPAASIIVGPPAAASGPLTLSG